MVLLLRFPDQQIFKNPRCLKECGTTGCVNWGFGLPSEPLWVAPGTIGLTTILLLHFSVSQNFLHVVILWSAVCYLRLCVMKMRRI